MAPHLEPQSVDPVQQLFELSVDMLGTASTDGYFTRLNPAWERTLGWSNEELMAEPFIAFVHPDDVDATLEVAARLSGPGRPRTVAFANRYRTRGGDYRTLEWTTVGDGGDLYFVAKDVTERNAAAVANRRAARVKAQGLAISSLGALETPELGLGGLLQGAAGALFAGLGADMAAVFEHADDGGAIVRAGAGEPVPPPPVPSTESSRRSFALIRNAGRPLLSADIRLDERFVGPTLREQGMVSIVAAPIGSSTDGFGFVGAASRREQAFSEDDLAFVQSVANTVSAAVERDRAITRATEAESRIADFWALSLDPLSIFAPDWTFLELNDAWERTLGWTREDLLGTDCRALVHPDDLEGTISASDPIRYRAKDGSWRRLLWSVHEAPGGDSYAVAKDITEMYRERELGQQREKQLNEAQRIAHMGSWESDPVSGELTVSESLRSMLGLDSLTLSLSDVFACVHPGDRAFVEGKFAERSVDPAPTEFRAVLPDGSVRTVSSHAVPVIEDGRIVLLRGMVQDVTEARTRELALRRSEERFRQGFDNAPIGMSLVDPASSRYVRVNDAFCRFVGREAEELLTLTVGDVTHPDDDGEQAGEQRYLRPDGTVVWGSLSVSSAFDTHGSVDVTFAQVVDITERKEREASVARQLGEVNWLTEIRQAFEEDRFELHAQPIVDIATGELIQHELLIRMRGRDGELIPPGDFLPAAEKYGTIKEIDRWVISQGAEVAAGGMAVGVNLSGVSLADPTLVAHVESELERSGADPSLLVFEITETALIEAGDMALRLTQQIREFGCRFALDDFGTGYGGLQHLKTLPLDFLKIDREFVRTAVTSEDDRHLIWAVVNLAKRFGLKTVAEGVEDQATLELLAEMDVDHAQGFHLGRPAPLPAQRRRSAIPVSASRRTRSATSAE